MRSLITIIGICSLLFVAQPASAAEREPVAHIVEVDLQGEDLTKGTAIVREGEELKPAIWMPLYDGDIIFVRDPKSHVLVDYGSGGRAQVDQTRTRLAISEATAHGGENWSLISALGELLAGEESEEVPTNLISKGDDGTLTVPVANRTPNFIVRDQQPVWIEWSGGKAPFTLTFEGEGGPQSLPATQERQVRFTVPPEAAARLVLIIEDAQKRRVRVPLRLKDAAPQPPGALANAATSPDLSAALTAGWLAKQEEGAWRIEAARILRNAPGTNEQLKILGDALFAGWTPD